MQQERRDAGAHKPNQSQRRGRGHVENRKAIKRGHKKPQTDSAEEQPQAEQRDPAHGAQDARLKEPPLGLTKVEQADNKLGRTFHATGQRRCRTRQERTQPAPKAMARLRTGLRRTWSPTSSTPAAPAS